MLRKGGTSSKHFRETARRKVKYALSWLRIVKILNKKNKSLMNDAG